VPKSLTTSDLLLRGALGSLGPFGYAIPASLISLPQMLLLLMALVLAAQGAFVGFITIALRQRLGVVRSRLIVYGALVGLGIGTLALFLVAGVLGGSPGLNELKVYGLLSGIGGGFSALATDIGLSQPPNNPLDRSGPW
jgi:hypothetical protein